MTSNQVTEPTVRGEYGNRVLSGFAALAVLAGAGTLTLVAGDQAEARGGGIWTRLAVCESGGRWHIDTGNGFSGGLQFSHSTWRAFGGGAYARRAAHATRSQQIRIAERVLARQGWGAWPACSARLGLRSAGARPAAAEVASAARGTDAPARRSHTGTTHERHAAFTKPSGIHVVIKPGDTLSGIASAHGVDWRELHRLNRRLIGVNAHIILPGVRIIVPGVL
ncbi:transglycosylase family protein [Streptomyces sp. NPDC003077]|uniref:transglycosylase family protein n=1 Tax=Streptomyces sp. NPDC003077 TaxID=3154443 RepID=UPI0033B54414